jgi:hypothetical protein
MAQSPIFIAIRDNNEERDAVKAWKTVSGGIDRPSASAAAKRLVVLTACLVLNGTVGNWLQKLHAKTAASRVKGVR